MSSTISASTITIPKFDGDRKNFITWRNSVIRQLFAVKNARLPHGLVGYFLSAVDYLNLTGINFEALADPGVEPVAPSRADFPINRNAAFVAATEVWKIQHASWVVETNLFDKFSSLVGAYKEAIVSSLSGSALLLVSGEAQLFISARETWALLSNMYVVRTNADLTRLINSLQLAYIRSTCFIEHIIAFSANLENLRVLQNPLPEFLKLHYFKSTYKGIDWATLETNTYQLPMKTTSQCENLKLKN